MDKEVSKRTITLAIMSVLPCNKALELVSGLFGETGPCPNAFDAAMLLIYGCGWWPAKIPHVKLEFEELFHHEIEKHRQNPVRLRSMV